MRTEIRKRMVIPMVILIKANNAVSKNEEGCAGAGISPAVYIGSAQALLGERNKSVKTIKTIFQTFLNMLVAIEIKTNLNIFPL